LKLQFTEELYVTAQLLTVDMFVNSSTGI